MNVKRYLAPDVQEAMKKVRLEMGRDAVILHTRKIKQKGIKGWFSKPLVEVVAAIDDEEVKIESVKTERKVAIQPQPHFSHQYRQEPSYPGTPQAHYNQTGHTQAYASPQAQVQEYVQNPPVNPPLQQETEQKKEIDALKAQMSNIAEMLTNVISQVDLNKGQSTEPPVGQEDEHPLMSQLKESDVTGEIRDKILSIVKRQVNFSNANDKAVRNAFKVVIRDMMGVPFKIDDASTEQRVLFFVGPTGVGKTTTLAKIAAKLSLVDNKKVGLITADTYRIAAVDQLKTYSEILSTPLDVIYEPSELEATLRKHKDKDFVLIDTAGRNHKSHELEEDLQALLSHVPNATVFLVISLTTGAKDVSSILNSYKFIDDFKLIFTKLDEAEVYGNMLNAKIEAGKPIAFVTNGQSVPDDIAVADNEKLAEMLLGE